VFCGGSTTASAGNFTSASNYPPGRTSRHAHCDRTAGAPSSATCSGLSLCTWPRSRAVPDEPARVLVKRCRSSASSLSRRARSRSASEAALCRIDRCRRQHLRHQDRHMANAARAGSTRSTPVAKHGMRFSSMCFHSLYGRKQQHMMQTRDGRASWMVGGINWGPGSPDRHVCKSLPARAMVHHQIQLWGAHPQRHWSGHPLEMSRAWQAVQVLRWQYEHTATTKQGRCCWAPAQPENRAPSS